jgi:hypothetical protein
MVTGYSRSHRFMLCLGLQVVLASQVLAADVYKATAKFTNAKGERVSAPVTISIEQRTSDTERMALVDKAKANPGAVKSAISGQKQLGYIEARDRRVPIRYAYARPGGEGQYITVISDEPLGHIGGDSKAAKPKQGFDLTYAMLMINSSGQGDGEMAPACKLKWMESGAPAVDDYGSQVVWLDDITKVAQP